MMIRKISIFSALSALALMAACTSTDDWQGEGDRVPITLTTAIAPTRTMALTQDEQLLNGETVYIWANQEATAGTTVWADNAYLKAWTLTANGTGALTPANDKYYPEKSMSMLALHGNLTYTEGTSAVPTGTLNHSVLTDQSTQANYAKSDLLIWAGNNVTKQATLPLQMHHKLSKIEIQLTSTDFTAAELNSAVVTITSIKPTAAVTIDNSVATTQGTMGSATGSATTITPYRADANEPEYEAIIPCGQAKPATLIHVKMSDETLSFDVNPDAPADAANFLENKRYHYTLTINRKAVAVTTSITDWDVIPTTAATTVAPFTMRMNPLWYVAQYNMASSRTSFVDAHSTSSQYVFLASTAATENVANYHLPSLYEYASIIPTDDETSSGTNVFKISNTLDSPYEYSEIPCNIGGKSIAGPTSYIGKKSSGDCYAIRFIGTPHASAWHYKWTNTPCNGLLIESYMLSKDMTVSEAQTLLANWKDNTPPNFTGTLGASGANLSPETTVITANGFVQRFFPAAGYTNSSNGTANSYVGTTAYYWGSQIAGSSNWTMMGANNDPSLGLQKTTMVRGFSIRLFKDDYQCSGKSLALAEIGDIICTHGKVYSPTTGDLPCGGQKAAMVAYLGSNNDAAGTGPYSESLNHGLAVALTEVANTSGDLGAGALNWTNGVTAASAYKCPAPPNTSGWFMVSAFQIQRIFIGCGSSKSFMSSSSSFDTHTDGSLPYANFLTYLSNCGGTSVSSTYWFSTNYTSSAAYIYYFGFQRYSAADKTNTAYVRPVLAF